jgi:tRNA wybutosine-synthesizing protein 1
MREWDDPEGIVEKSVQAQRVLLSGYFGLPERVPAKKLKEALEPRNVAISLAGEPTMYPRLSELIGLYKERGMTTFLVTNGTNPDVLETMELPWNLYLTLAAPDEAVYRRVCHPQIDGWSQIMRTVDLFSELATQRVIRLTLVKGMNMVGAEKYGEMIERASPDFVEAKAYMYVGFSRYRMAMENMPSFEDIEEFSKEISQYCSYRISDFQRASRVVLLKK